MDFNFSISWRLGHDEKRKRGINAENDRCKERNLLEKFHTFIITYLRWCVNVILCSFLTVTTEPERHCVKEKFPDVFFPKF